MRTILLPFLLIAPAACGGGNEADELGVGAQCTDNSECDEDTSQICLREFKGGYCGIENCSTDEECPQASACVAHTDGTNYCFRTCIDKAECNENRDAEQESNCSANIVFVEEQDEATKACVPPSG